MPIEFLILSSLSLVRVFSIHQANRHFRVKNKISPDRCAKRHFFSEISILEYRLFLLPYFLKNVLILTDIIQP